VKYLKINILPKLANPDNAPDIVAELNELVADTDQQLSRLAVRSMTRIACRNVGGPGCEQSVARRLVEMLDLNIDHICSEAATSLTHLIRKHPQLKEAIALSLPRALKYIQEPSGKASVVYLLGECGDVVPEAPYSIEKLIDGYENIVDPTIKSTLLSTTMKLFFKRPPEVQKMLGRLLSKVINDVTSQDLHDRGLLYYRMLQTDSKIVAAAITADSSLPSTVNFTEDDDVDLQKALMDEFNTLSITYGKTSENFISEKYQKVYSRMPPEHPLPPGSGTSFVPPPSVLPSVLQVVPAAESQSATNVVARENGMEDYMDLLGFGASPSSAPIQPPNAGLSLKVVSMTGDEYQNYWSTILDSEATVTAVPISSIPNNTDEVEQVLSAYNILTMASGELPNEFKFFLYAADGASDEVFLIQSNVSKGGEPLLILTIKATGASSSSKVQDLVDIIRTALN
jgi:AP-4 complex subunit beta-1